MDYYNPTHLQTPIAPEPIDSGKLSESYHSEYSTSKLALSRRTGTPSSTGTLDDLDDGADANSADSGYPACKRPPTSVNKLRKFFGENFNSQKTIKVKSVLRESWKMANTHLDRLKSQRFTDTLSDVAVFITTWTFSLVLLYFFMFIEAICMISPRKLEKSIRKRLPNPNTEIEEPTNGTN